MDDRTSWAILRRRWMLLAVCSLLGLAVAAAVTLLATPVYASSAQLFVSAHEPDAGAAAASSGGMSPEQRMTSYRQLVTSPRLTGPVIQELGLSESTTELPHKITTQNPPNTVLLDIIVSDTDPDRARRIAAALANSAVRRLPALERPQGATQAPVTLTVVRPANLPVSPSSPRAPRNLAAGLFTGLVVGAGGALTREALGRSVKGSDDLQTSIGAAPLGIVPVDPRAGKSPVIVAGELQAPWAQAMSGLQRNLRFVDVDAPPRSMVLTSAVAEEGTSTTCASLATSMAEAGLRVVLVEANLRRPRLARYLGLDSGAGLSGVLAGTSELDDALQPFGPNRLRVLTSGPLPPNPADLLGSRQLHDLLHRLLEQADVVLLDAPPLLAVPDAAILARVTDGAILVVRHGRTTREQVRRALAALAAAGARLLGAVLNAAPEKGRYGQAQSQGPYPPPTAPPRPARTGVIDLTHGEDIDSRP